MLSWIAEATSGSRLSRKVQLYGDSLKPTLWEPIASTTASTTCTICSSDCKILIFQVLTTKTLPENPRIFSQLGRVLSKALHPAEKGLGLDHDVHEVSSGNACGCKRSRASDALSMIRAIQEGCNGLAMDDAWPHLSCSRLHDALQVAPCEAWTHNTEGNTHLEHKSASVLYRPAIFVSPLVGTLMQKLGQ